MGRQLPLLGRAGRRRALIYRPLAPPGPPGGPRPVWGRDSWLRRSCRREPWRTSSTNLSLTPAAVPNSIPPEATVPVSQGDRALIDQDGGRITRTSAGDGGTRWVTRLVGEVGSVRPPHVVADADMPTSPTRAG